MEADGLELVRGFVNTFDVETGEDAIAAPGALETWAAGRGLGGAPATPVDVRRAQDTREALRALLIANAGGPDATTAWSVLERQARRSRVRLGFRPGGSELRPEATGTDAALGHVLAAVAAAVADGSWSRLKACPADDCQWAYIDRTRNGSRRWCDMRVCGNRDKVRTFRARHAPS